MAHYIDAEKLIAEIERLNSLVPYENNDRHDEGLHDAYKAVKNVIASLQQEQPETEMKSPFTGGKVTILSREEEVTFRGEKIKVTRNYYRCVDTGREFTDSKLDDDMMWAAFRSYCVKKGMTSFTDIMLKQWQPEVDLEKAAMHVYESWMGGTMNDVRRDMVELGKVLNARKEDKK